MNRLLRTMGIIVFSTGLTQTLFGQGPIGSLLQIDVHNHRVYVMDADRSQLAKSSAPLSRPNPATFESWIGIGDIVSVNGNPVKGTVFERSITITTAPSLTPGAAISDAARGGIYEWNLDLQNTDGTSIGRILIQGLSGGPSPPGAPSTFARAEYMVVGGTGAFLGVRGGYYVANVDPSTPNFTTSAAEDPAFRRINGGGTLHLSLFLIPQSWPEIINTSSGPAVVHAVDSTLVTTSKPAASGEILSLYGTGLGPTRPGADPGQPFPSGPLAAVNSPVAVTVNGKSAEVLGAAGYPTAVNGYVVNFRVPDGTSAGQASVQLASAWINSPVVKIAIR